MKYHGDELAVYPDSLAMTAAMQELYRQHNEAIDSKTVAKTPVKRDLSLSRRDLLPPELVGQENGIAVYFNVSEGQEIMTGFNDVVSGLKKRGYDLTEDEAEAIQSLMDSEDISPNFVRRLVKEHGDESIASVFLIDNTTHKTYLDYLLRRYKGHFYRKRYPQIALV